MRTHTLQAVIRARNYVHTMAEQKNGEYQCWQKIQTEDNGLLSSVS